MAIPDYQSVMLPLLKYHQDEKEHCLGDAIEAMCRQFSLAEKEQRELLPSGRQPIVDNRVGWATTYLVKAGLLERPRRGYTIITPRGKETLQSKPKTINVPYLRRFKEFQEFQSKRDVKPVEAEPETSMKTPEEALELAYQKTRESLAVDLLQKITTCSPSFFERLVIEVIVKMGYGGTRQDAGRAVGKSGDGGIDGIIKEDKLGLDTIYIQAKRWGSTVSRPEIQKFVGALTGQRAKKGLFITTSDFTREAEDYVSRIDTKIVLIDGETLAQLMIDHNVGVSSIATYDLKKIDTDYFTEE